MSLSVPFLMLLLLAGLGLLAGPGLKRLRRRADRTRRAVTVPNLAGALGRAVGRRAGRAR